jgi:peptidoglycan/LPS O-acetylase OafA/YrhL
MGYLRLWLAVEVMFSHFGLPAGLPPLDGGAAVRGFFVLSGYVISLILQGRYAGRTALYLKLRFLRIYPAYWAALLLTLGAWALVYHGWHLQRGPLALMDSQGLDAAAKAGLSAQQVLLLGMDANSMRPLSGLPWFHYYLMPHASTLSVELCFYLAAPWLLKLADPWLLSGALFSLGLRWMDPGNLAYTAWFPTEIGYFCLGLLAYRRQAGWKAAPRELAALGALCAAALLLAPYAGGAGAYNLMVPLAAAVAAPVLHRLSAAWRGDRVAGELSYSLYLIHPIAGLALAMRIRGFGPWPRAGLLLAGSLAAAAAFWALVDRPLEKMRRRQADLNS